MSTNTKAKAKNKTVKKKVKSAPKAAAPKVVKDYRKIITERLARDKRSALGGMRLGYRVGSPMHTMCAEMVNEGKLKSTKLKNYDGHKYQWFGKVVVKPEPAAK